jgi:NAD(P)-dependent dehydrogenase (short-subunit alcohol dehydrogenase family)/uncharacterized OB-fold protein
MSDELQPGGSQGAPQAEPVLPPRTRSRVALGLTSAAAVGRFELQECRVCHAVQYPPREVCHRCLSSSLDWKPQSGVGELISETRLLHSHHEFFRHRVPIRLGLVRLESGPTAVAYLHSSVGKAPARVKVAARLDKAGLGVLVAHTGESGTARSAGREDGKPEDRHLEEMSNDPRGRKVLVSDGTTALGAALIQRLVDAGAAVVWAGQGAGAAATKDDGDPPIEHRGARVEPPAEFARAGAVQPLALNLASDESVIHAAGSIGSQVDIVINNADVMGSAREQMEAHYFSLVRLSKAFGPPMRVGGAMAWVNVLSMYALSSLPALEDFSASMAAAYSCSQSLRADLSSAGVRVVNIFPGPIEGARFSATPVPRLTAAALAGAIVASLQDGVEDVYPGDVAQEWFTRWRADPKVLEREIASAASTDRRREP